MPSSTMRDRADGMTATGTAYGGGRGQAGRLKAQADRVGSALPTRFPHPFQHAPASSSLPAFLYFTLHRRFFFPFFLPPSLPPFPHFLPPSFPHPLHRRHPNGAHAKRAGKDSVLSTQFQDCGCIPHKRGTVFAEVGRAKRGATCHICGRGTRREGGRAGWA